MKILILKPSSLGDIVQALPVLRLLKRHLPASEIYWWVDSRWLDLLTADPDLTGVIQFHRRRWARPWRWNEALASIRQIRALRFDWVLDLQALVRSGIVCWLSNAAWKVGLDDVREGAPAFYDLAVRRPNWHTHAVDWYLEVLRILGVPIDHDFEWLPSRPVVAENLRWRWNVGPEPLVLMQPGARWVNKRWPAESFVEVVARLGARHPRIQFGVLGSSEEGELGRMIAASLPHRVLNLTGGTSLPEMIEGIRLSALLITNDTGPMHVAAALGRPVVALFGPTEPRRTGPYGQLDRVLQSDSLSCVPCMRSACHYHLPVECLRGLSVESVVEAASKVLRATAVN